MATTSLTGKRVLFLLVNGFQSDRIDSLWDCLYNRGARVWAAGANEGETLAGSEGGRTRKSDYSFLRAAQEPFDAVIVADDATGRALREHAAAMDLLATAWERGSAMVAVGAGVATFGKADILGDRQVTVTDEERAAVLTTGAVVTDQPIAVSENIITARPDADLAALCNTITNFLLRGTEHKEDRWVA